jgi:competence protein ComEC
LKRYIVPLIAFLLLALAVSPVWADWTGGHDVMGASEAHNNWYFAEGCTRAGFETWLCIQNPNDSQANVTIQYFLESGEVRTLPVTCKPTSRTTISVNDTCSGEHDVASRATSNIPVIVERPMYFQRAGADGGHCAMGVQAASDRWLFAEGCTQPGFEEWLCVLNPNGYSVDLNFNYYFEDLPNISLPINVPANTRYTQRVNDVVPAGKNLSVEISGVGAEDTIIAERPMYFTYRYGWNGGHDEVGKTELSTTWDFAEGCTRAGFETWITIENPSEQTAFVQATYMLATGQNIEKAYSVAPKSRKTVFVADEVGPEQDVSTSLVSDLPIAAERPMYFGYHDKWDGGSDSFGSTAKQSAYYFAEGCTRSGFETWLCVQNPNHVPVTLRVKLYKETGEVQALPDILAPAKSRTTIDLNLAAGPEHDISLSVECTDGLPIVAERPMYFGYRPTHSNTTMTAKFLDVGQGDSCILKITSSGSSFFALVDTGGIGDTSSNVVSELKAMGCSRLDVLVLTHPDADHIGGAVAVMNSFAVDRVWDPGIDGRNTQTWQEVKSTISSKGIPREHPQAGATYSWNGVQTQVLNPPAGASYSEINDYSIVMVETLGSQDIMLTGDAQTDSQQFMMGESFPDIEVFKVPHHGADSGYYAPFFNKVHPPWSVISVGPNSYGHPSAAVISALSAFGTVYRTDYNGDVTVSATTDSLQIATEKDAQAPQPEPNPGEGPFVGSVNSDVYHYPWCSYAQQIKPENLVTFATAQDAVNAGYRPCKICNPPLPQTILNSFFLKSYIQPMSINMMLPPPYHFSLYLWDGMRQRFCRPSNASICRDYRSQLKAV